MEPEGSLPHSQEPATCPYPEPYQSSPLSHIENVNLKYWTPINNQQEIFPFLAAGQQASREQAST
jgi:hypothetical protein